MNFLPSRFVILAVVAALAYSAPAQQGIVFSKPAGDVTEKANSFMPSRSPLRGTAGSFNAPSSIFSTDPAESFDELPGAPRQAAISPEEIKRWEKTLESKKKWTLLTPEEILGLPTPEKMLGLPDSKTDEKLTIEERYLARQNHGMAAASTNGSLSARLLREDSPDNPFRPQPQNERTFNPNPAAQTGPGFTKYFNQFLKATPNTPFGVEPKSDTLWQGPFKPPPPAVKPDLAHEAAMERFRALLEPNLPSDNLPIMIRPGSFPVPNPNLQMLLPVNPAGRSFTPIQKIGRAHV